jgi:hypothetical protein
MQVVTAVLAFLVVFAIVFFLAGWFLMPHLPPTPKVPVSVFELAYWTNNWAGAVLGLLLGGFSARASLKPKPAK